MKREKTLDCLRGWAMIQVVFVHIIYWMNLFNTGPMPVIKSFALFEMSVLFFVTGAVNSLGKTESYRTFCVKRLKGLLIPYYVYSALCVAIVLGQYLLQKQLTVRLAASVAVSWLIPLDYQISPFPYLTWAIWFVPVYIVSILLFPAVKRAVSKFGEGTVLLSVLLFLVVEGLCRLASDSTWIGHIPFDVSSLLSILQKSAFYLIFLCLGLFYAGIKSRRREYTVTAGAVLLMCLTGLLLTAVVWHRTLNMQENKFPPNLVFLMYSFVVLSVIYLAFPVLKKAYLRITHLVPLLDRLVMDFSKYSVYVFLYQSFSFYLVRKIGGKLNLHRDVLYLVYSVFTLYPLLMLTIRIVSRLQMVRRRGSFSLRRKSQ